VAPLLGFYSAKLLKASSLRPAGGSDNRPLEEGGKNTEDADLLVTKL